MEIPITVQTRRELIAQYIDVINGFLPKDSSLTKGERDVLREIMFYDDPTRKEPDRGSMLLDYKTVKQPIMFDLMISKPRLANIISSLKKKGALYIENGQYALHFIYKVAVESELPINLNIEWHIDSVNQ